MTTANLTHIAQALYLGPAYLFLAAFQLPALSEN